MGQGQLLLRFTSALQNSWNAYEHKQATLRSAGGKGQGMAPEYHARDASVNDDLQTMRDFAGVIGGSADRGRFGATSRYVIRAQRRADVETRVEQTNTLALQSQGGINRSRYAVISEAVDNAHRGGGTLGDMVKAMNAELTVFSSMKRVAGVMDAKEVTDWYEQVDAQKVHTFLEANPTLQPIVDSIVPVPSASGDCSVEVVQDLSLANCAFGSLHDAGNVTAATRSAIVGSFKNACRLIKQCECDPIPDDDKKKKGKRPFAMRSTFASAGHQARIRGC